MKKNMVVNEKREARRVFLACLFWVNLNLCLQLGCIDSTILELDWIPQHHVMDKNSLGYSTILELDWIPQLSVLQHALPAYSTILELDWIPQHSDLQNNIDTHSTILELDWIPQHKSRRTQNRIRSEIF